MKKNFILLAFLWASLFINAQSEYSVTALNEPYVDLTQSISLNDGEVWDDPEYTIPIGFEFQISNHRFETIFIFENGLGGLLSNTTNDETGIIPFFIPIGQDIVDLGFGTGTSLSNISYITEGTAGNQILKIEWNNVGFVDDETGQDFIDFQLWLYEVDNTVEYRYGPNEVNNPDESYEGLTGPTVGLFTSVNLDEEEFADVGYYFEDNPAEPTIITIQNGDQIDEIQLNGTIPNGTVYRFTPKTLSVNEFNDIDFVVYPNPTRDFLNFKTNSTLNSMSVFNQLGQRISQVPIESNTADVSALENGIYFLEIVTTNGRSTLRFIKE